MMTTSDRAHHAVRFTLSIPRYLLGRVLGGVSDAVVFGWPSGLRMVCQDLAPLPGPHWVELDVIAAGICGTDVANLTYKSSPVLEPFASFPAVLGHEILARVRSTGPDVARVRPGQRVVVDPLVSCALRGFAGDDRCQSCRDGRPATCARAGECGRTMIGGRSIGPGITIGYHRDLPGGWGACMLAHEEQLVPVDERLGDHAAVLIEPLAVAVHAVLAAPPRGAALVIGSGPIALATVWALRALGHDGAIVAQVRRPREQALALEFGASEVVTPGRAARGRLLETGARAYRPLSGGEVYAGGGFPSVYDCVGSGSSVQQGLRFTAPRGQMTMVGCAGLLRRLDLTLLWARELTMRGSVAYGREVWCGADLHTFEVTQRLVLATAARVAKMVTHTYPLDQYRAALTAARHRRDSGAVKVLLTPPSGSSPR